jgi:proteasome lid subunit RPN8/RPN11
MDPDEQLAVWRSMDERGEQPVVIYHSHTATAAYPSKPDIAYASEYNAHYVIVATGTEPPEVRSYRIASGFAAEEAVLIDGRQTVTEPG